MARVSDNDHTPMGLHPHAGLQQAVMHACPDCPSPGVAGGPTPFCHWCLGTGLVTGDTLGRWQRNALDRSS